MPATNQRQSPKPGVPKRKTLTAHLPAEDMRLIDTACALLQSPRQTFAIAATIAAARKVLEEKNINWPPEAA